MDLSRTDWERRIAAGETLLPDDAERFAGSETGQRAVAIFDRLRLPDVQGTPALADAAGAWFRDIVGALLGSLDPDSGVRAIRELFLLAAKKSSKTSYGAALMLTALIMNTRPRAEYLLISPTQAISDLSFSQAEGMIRLDAYLLERFHIQQHLKTITDRTTRAQLKIKTFDSNVLTGVKPAGVLLDELHEIAKNAKASRIIGQIRGGLLPIPEAFLAFITTQSDEPPSGAFLAELSMARAIRDGRAQGAMLPVLYEFPRAIVADRADPPAWQDHRNWWMVTPNVGRSVTIERLVPEFETAKIKGEAELRRWASQHLNIEIGIGLYSDRWPGAEFWQDAAEELDLAELLRRCDVAVIGIDGGGLDDLLGLAVLGRETGSRRWLSWCRAWAHSAVLDRRKKEAPRLLDFAARGDVVIVDRLGQDIEEVADTVEAVADSGLLPDKEAIGLDPVGIGQIIDELGARGIENERLAAVSQGWKMAGAIKTTERKLADGTMVHAAQPLMDWCVGNAKQEARGNAVLITKQVSGSAKIDPLMALFNAAALMSRNPEAATIYADDRELRFA